MAIVDAAVLITGKTDMRKQTKMLTPYRFREQSIGRCYTPNGGIPFFIKQVLLEVKLQINLDRVVGSDFNAPLSIIVSSSKRKRKQRNSELNDILDKMDPNGHLQITLYKHDKIFTLLRSPWNFLQDGSCI